MMITFESMLDLKCVVIFCSALGESTNKHAPEMLIAPSMIINPIKAELLETYSVFCDEQELSTVHKFTVTELTKENARTLLLKYLENDEIKNIVVVLKKLLNKGDFDDSLSINNIWRKNTSPAKTICFKNELI